LLPDRALSATAVAKTAAVQLVLDFRKALPMKKLGKSYQRSDENFLDSALALLNKTPK
jgi:hypothetical protein